MRFKGSCQCKNIQIEWSLVDTSLVPRACQCSYCREKKAAYISKSGTRVEVSIAKPELHTIHLQGDEIAQFHECGNCEDLVFVSATIDNHDYCAVNVHTLDKADLFPNEINADFTQFSKEQSLALWKQNWCDLETIRNKNEKSD